MTPKPHYFLLDLLKFACAIGIVAYHTRFLVGYPVLDAVFWRFNPVFVALFFAISSALLWGKMRGSSGDLRQLTHFTRRLLILVALWGMVLLPHWLPKFMRHNPDDWALMLLPKILCEGFAQGSWFIMALIYAAWAGVILNKLCPRHLIFTLVALLWAYLSLVHYDGMPDYLHLHHVCPDESFGFDTYVSPVRGLIWVEFSYYLLPLLLRIPTRLLAGMLAASLVALGWIERGYFVLVAIIVLSLLGLGMRLKTVRTRPGFVFVRKMSIITFFVHFPVVSLTHVLFTKGVITHEYGLDVFAVTLAAASLVSVAIIRLSKRWPLLTYFF